MYEIVAIVTVTVALVYCTIFWVVVFTNLVKESGWKFFVGWLLSAAAVIPLMVGLGYLVGRMFPFSDAVEGGMICFGFAGGVIAIFMLVHIGTNSIWYRRNVGDQPGDIPVTRSMLKWIVGLPAAATIVTMATSWFPFPVEIHRLCLATPFMASLAGVFIGCVIESRRKASRNSQTCSSDDDEAGL